MNPAVVAFRLMLGHNHKAMRCWSCGGMLAVVLTAACTLEPLASTVDAPVISGPSLTNERRPTWQWTSGEPRLYRLALDSADLDAVGWQVETQTYTPKSELADGLHTLYVQHSNGRYWSDTAAHSLRIDTTPPLPPEVNVDVTSPTSTAIPDWSWTSQEENNTLFRFRLDAVDLDAEPVVAVTEYTPVLELSEGAHVLYVSEQDTAGNWSALAFSIVEIDLTAPLPPVLTCNVAASADGTYATTAAQPTWLWQSAGGGNGVFRYVFDASTELDTNTTSFTPDAALPVGMHKLRVRERDAAGNWSTEAILTIEVVAVEEATEVDEDTEVPAEFATASSGASSSHVCTRLPGQGLKCWGKNYDGQLGLEDIIPRGASAGQMGAQLPLLPFGVPDQIAVGGSHTCARFGDTLLYCWGDNSVGQLGLGDDDDRGATAGTMTSELLTVDAGSGMLDIAAGERHTCAAFQWGHVECWGLNSSGQLGVDGINDEWTPVGNRLDYTNKARQLALGRLHSCARLGNGGIKCWGDNQKGQLGLGLPAEGTTRVVGDSGDDGGEMATLAPVDLGYGHTARHVSAGLDHTCALLDTLEVLCWGDNTYGQLGLGDVQARGNSAADMGDNLPIVDLGSAVYVIDLAAGGEHNCALLDDGSVKCWGRNTQGQLGIGAESVDHRGDVPGEMGDALPGVDLGLGRTALRITAGKDSSCAVLDDGGVKCWGGNAYGQLGQGHELSIGLTAASMGDALPAIELE